LIELADLFFAGCVFIIFSLLAAMTVLQMLIGVLCEVVDDTTIKKAAAKDVAVMKCQIVERLRKFDVEGDGTITQRELDHIMQDGHTKDILSSLNINELFLSQMLQLLFPRPDSVVAFKPLTEMLLLCRGDNQASVETMASGFSYVVDEIKTLQVATEEKINELESSTVACTELLKKELESVMYNGLSLEGSNEQASKTVLKSGLTNKNLDYV